MRRIAFICFLALTLPAMAQNDAFEKFREQQRAAFDRARNSYQDQYDEFRRKVNMEYAEFMRQAWAEFPVHEPIVPPVEEELPPVEYVEPEVQSESATESTNEEPEQSALDTLPVLEARENPAPDSTTNWSFSLRNLLSRNKQDSAKSEEQTESPKRFQLIPSKKISVSPAVTVVPKPTPAPAPIAPVNPQGPSIDQNVAVDYFGCGISLSFPRPDNLNIEDIKEETLAKAWKMLAGKQYDITVKSAMDARDKYELCDWAYMGALRTACEEHYGAGNEATFMQAFLMTQSGYRVRLAKAGEKLFLLVASNYEIFNVRYLTMNGEKFYIMGEHNGERLQMCPSKYDKEQSLSMQIARLPKCEANPTPKRKLVSRKGVMTSVSVNKNLIDFFNQYPQANVDGDFTTRWAAYANTPLEKSVRDELYPPLKRTIASMSELEAVSILLNWVQTAFPYALDDTVWGNDRAFFAQETLYYPKCDCEDRAILFTRLVRDLVGLDVALIYYPGHLAAAVAFNEDVKGDWLEYEEKRYVVCDPTYIPAPVGWTMPSVDNNTAKLIILK